MSAVAILNVILAGLVVAAILLILGWGILTDPAIAVSRTRRERHIARGTTARAAAQHRGQMLDFRA